MTLLAGLVGQKAGTWLPTRVFAAASTSQEAVLYEEDFEDAQAQDWELESGWAIIQDTDANRVLSGKGAYAALYHGDAWGDYTLKLRVKIAQGVIELGYRVRDCLRYTIVFGTGVLSLRKASVCGTSQLLSRYPEVHDPDRWYEIEITGTASNLQVREDGVLRLSYVDADPLLYGTITLATGDDSEAYVDDVVILGQKPPDVALRWIRTGGPLGGMGYDIRMRPDNPDIMYVTDAWSGVHVSTDGGLTWRASNEGITTRAGPSGDAIPVFSLTIDPHNPEVIWCGTQGCRGIFKSTDGGETWVRKDNGVVGYQGISVRGFTVDPQDSHTVYAAIEVSSFAWTPNGEQRLGRDFDMTEGAVYKTTDGGEHWVAVWQGDNLARYIWIDPRDHDVLYVSTGIFDREAANSDYTRHYAGGVGVLKSIDGGRTWEVLDQKNGLGNLFIGSLFMNPENPDILLAGVGNDEYGEGSGVYLTTNGGESWQCTLDASSDVGGISSVEFASANPNIAYAGGLRAFYRSVDGGRTWTRQTQGSFWGPPGVVAGQPIDFQVDPRDPDRIFVNNYGGGNFLSLDGGRTWSVASQGYTGALLLGICVDSRDPERVFAIGRSGPFRSDDGGTTWEGLAYEPAAFKEYYDISLSPEESNTVLDSSELHGTLHRSTDEGYHWETVFQHPSLLSEEYGRHGFKTIVFASSSPSVVYGGMCVQATTLEAGEPPPSFGIYKSIDDGLTWREANDAHTADQNVNVLAVAPGNASMVYAGTVDGGVFKTIDGGAAWQALNQGLRVLDVRALAIDPVNEEVLYAGAENGGVYKSTNGGTSWQSSSSGMDPQAEVRAIVIDPSNPKVLYAADLRTGVFRSQDGAKTWVKITTGLRTRAVSALAISSDGKVLYAATEGEGVFRLDLP